MDERFIAVLFLLLAGILPLRELSADWAARPERRGAVRALWIVYGLLAVIAAGALLVVTRREAEPRSPPATQSQQLARAESSGCTIGTARA